MKSAILVLAAVTAAVPALAQESRTVAIMPRHQGHLRISVSDTMGTPFTIELPTVVTAAGTRLSAAARAYVALADVYNDLKLEITADSANLAVGNLSFFARGDFAGRRMSLWLECGEGMTGPWADAYKIQMSLISFLKPQGDDAAELRTSLLANAVNVTEGVSRTQMCNTTGELERKIYQLVVKKLK